MDFLRAIFNGEALTYEQLEQAINAHNGNEANKNNQLKIGNLGTGEYVGKGKYDSLQEMLNGKETELTSANELIAQLKKDTKGNEELQGKISAYETQVTDLQAELAETKMKSAIKVELLSAGVAPEDIDYLTFKLNESLKEKGETLELDENDNIKGWDARLDGLKTQFPKQFETGKGDDGYKPLENNGLPKGDPDNQLTKEQILKKPYAKRMEIYNNNPEAYKKAMNS